MRFSRYVAIGDSSTEGLEDPYPDGGYRGWADRLAEQLAAAQPEPLEYANLAVRGLRLAEIRDTQFAAALDLQPDLMTIFGGVNDVLSRVCDFALVRTHLAAMFGQARARGVTVLTFTMPDPSAINPLGRRLRPRMFLLNDIIRAEADRHGVLMVDFQQYPVTEDPRLWYDDRLHGNALGHERVAAALAWRLGVDGADDSWSTPLDVDRPAKRVRQQLAGDVNWAVHHYVPWLSRTLRHIPQSLDVTAKRPRPTVVDPTRTGRAAAADAGSVPADDRAR